MAKRLFSLSDDDGGVENIDWSLDGLNEIVVTGDFGGVSSFALTTVAPPGSYASVLGLAATLYAYSTTAFASLFTINFQEQTASGQTATGYLYSTNGAAARTRRLSAMNATVSSIPANSTATTSVTYAALGEYQGFELVCGDADATVTNNTTHGVTSDTHTYVYLLTNGVTKGTHSLGLDSSTATFVGGVGGYGLVDVSNSDSLLLSEDVATGDTTTLIRQKFVGSYSDLYDDVGGGCEFVAYASGGNSSVYATNGAQANALFSHAGVVSFQGAYLGSEVFRVDDSSTQSYYATVGTLQRTSLMLTAPLADTVKVTADALKIEFNDINPSADVVQRAWYDAESGQLIRAGQDYVWSGGTTGYWDNGPSWYDATTGQMSRAAPNDLDAVLVNPASGGGEQTIFGGGPAYFVIVAGSLQTDVLNVKDMAIVGGDAASPTIYTPGDILASGEASVYNQMQIYDSHAGFIIRGKRSSLSVGHKMVFDDGGAGVQESVVRNHARVYVGGLAFSGGDGNKQTALLVDGDSLLEVGGGTKGHEGTITVDSGAEIDLGANGSQDNRIDAPTFVVNGSIVSSTPTALGHANALQAFKVVNHGLISGVSVNNIALVNNAGTISLDNNSLGATINDGVLIAAGGVNVLAGDVTGVGSIEIAEGGTLKTQQIAAGQTLSYTGVAGALSISQSSLDTFKTYDATIEGFGDRRVITYLGTVTSADYSGGVLTLTDGAAIVAHLNLAGDYSGATFAVSQSTGYARITATGAGAASAPVDPAALLGGDLVAASTSTEATTLAASPSAPSLSASALGLH